MSRGGGLQKALTALAAAPSASWLDAPVESTQLRHLMYTIHVQGCFGAACSLMLWLQGLPPVVAYAYNCRYTGTPRKKEVA